MEFLWYRNIAIPKFISLQHKIDTKCDLSLSRQNKFSYIRLQFSGGATGEFTAGWTSTRRLCRRRHIESRCTMPGKALTGNGSKRAKWPAQLCSFGCSPLISNCNAIPCLPAGVIGIIQQLVGGWGGWGCTVFYTRHHCSCQQYTIRNTHVDSKRNMT